MEEKQGGQRLGRVLTDMGLVDEDQLLNLLSQQVSIPFVDLKKFDFDISLVRKLPETMARRFRAIVLREEGEGYLVGMIDPMDIFAVDELSRALKRHIQQAVVREGKRLNPLDVIYGRKEEIASFAEQLEEE